MTAPGQASQATGVSAGDPGGALRPALAYGLTAAVRRVRTLALPAITVAIGSFLLVLVVALLPAVRAQGAALGAAAEIGRATVVITVIVLLVGALEVAIAATRSITQRTREIGVLAGFGVPQRAVACGLMVEPVLTAVVGAALGSVFGLAVALTSGATGLTATTAAPYVVALTAAGSVAISAVASAVAAVTPVLRAVRRPPLQSLNP